MGEPSLQGKDILVVEDEYLLASELERELRSRGANVLGPVASADKARALIASRRPHAAVLDINLHSSSVFPFADDLIAAKIPFMFATGYDCNLLPARFDGVQCFEKPIGTRDLMHALATLAAGAKPAQPAA